MNRRELLKFCTGCALLPAEAAAQPTFRHRSYLGWITDLSSRPDSEAAWPSMRLDDKLLDDYERSFAVMQKLGFNEIVIWGLYVANDWPLDIESCVTEERGKKVERLLESARRHGLKVLNGLGVYSWGYATIIRANPHLNRGNPNAMCASEPDSWKWMQKILEFTFGRFPLDGASMQSADRGRCTCDRCGRWNDAEYHSRINIQAADFIRSKWQDKIVGVSGWGMKFEDPANWPHVRALSEHIDYIIDVDNGSQRRDPANRRKLIAQLKCDFGSLGGLQVEPPQHWDRERWFLPTVQQGGKHLANLRADGGRACEYFYHIMNNPGDEVSMWVEGKCLSHPDVSWREHLRSSIGEIYRVQDDSVIDGLCEAFLAAENAYMKFMPERASGTISMEPLVSTRPGPPVYLSKRLNAEQRGEYSASLEKVAADFKKLMPSTPERGRMEKILRCISNVGKDAASLS